MLLGWGVVWLLSAGSFGGAPNAPVVLDSDFYERDPAKEALGKLLFYDKVLSGNRNISCATCHHPFTGTGDALSLPVGEGGVGLGLARTSGVGQGAVRSRVPRNAPALFNLGAKEFVLMFHDGRVMVDRTRPSGFSTPAGDDLPQGLDNVLAAQAMFPVTSADEMAGHPGENPVAAAAAAGNLAGSDGVWSQLAARVRSIEGYSSMFIDAFADVNDAQDITMVHVANAIAAFEAAAFRCTNAPFDRYLRGDESALSEQAVAGMMLFYGKAGCVNCHSGSFQTDQKFHAIAMPQIGPGKGDNLPGFNDGRDDFGRERVSANSADQFRFRTPSLRQVALTGPWGHDGAYRSLEAVVRHHLDPEAALASYDLKQPILPSRSDLDALDFIVQQNPARRQAIAAANELRPSSLSDAEVTQLLAFLDGLTDLSCIDYSASVPEAVPSGLPLCADGCMVPGKQDTVVRRVARLVTNDPPGPDADHYVGDEELLASVRAWVRGERLPGQVAPLDDPTVVTLVIFWINKTPLP